MKQLKLIVLIVFVANNLFAQTEPIPTYKVGIFAPLYLDSIFTNGVLKNKESIPKFVQPSLEFVQGVQIAIDSLKIKKTLTNLERYYFSNGWFDREINFRVDSLDLKKAGLTFEIQTGNPYKIGDISEKIESPVISYETLVIPNGIFFGMRRGKSSLTS